MGPRVAQLVLAGFAAVCLSIALSTYGMDWHEVREGSFGQGLGCLFSHGDCAPSHSQGAPMRDSGLDHGGPVVLVMLLMILGNGVVAVARPRQVAGLICASGLVAMAIATFIVAVGATFMAHFLDHNRSLAAEGAFFGAVIGLIGLAIPILVLTAVLHARARRRPPQGVMLNR